MLHPGELLVSLRGCIARPVPPSVPERGKYVLKREWRLPIPLHVDAAQRDEILTRYREHAYRFSAVAARRGSGAELIALPEDTSTPEAESALTGREVEVLQLVSEGLVNREIGLRLYLSEETVKSHVRHLLAKLQARSRAHAVAVGFRRGLLT